MALINKLSAVGDAIREKTGKEDLIKLKDMPQEISNISNYELINQIFGKTIADLYLPQVTNIANSSGLLAGAPLKSVLMPDLVSIFGSSTFANCPSLEVVDMPNLNILNGHYTFEGSSAIKKLVFPKIIKANGSALFRNCTSLETVDIGEAVIIDDLKLRQYSFYNCQSLNTLILRNLKAWTCENRNIFTDTPIANGTGYIYVPKALIEEYKVATNWVSYANQFRAIEDYPDICGGVTE